jgi:hypothetical protein
MTPRQALRLKRKKLRARANAARSELAQVVPLLERVEEKLRLAQGDQMPHPKENHDESQPSGSNPQS